MTVPSMLAHTAPLSATRALLLWCSAVAAGMTPFSIQAQDQGVDAASRMNRTLMEMVQRMGQLEQEMRQLRGDVEVLSHDMQGVTQRQREMYLDIDRRMQELERGAVHSQPSVSGTVAPADAAVVTSPPAAQAGPGAATPPPVTPVTQAPSQEERDSYNRAFNMLKEGRYDQSISAFEGFIKSHPGSSYADNAQYWLGEANYVSRKFKQAVVEFNKVIESFPQSPKVADAMLKLGFTYYELADWKAARGTLQKVVAEFPRSSAARLAETRLQRMSKEGH